MRARVNAPGVRPRADRRGAVLPLVCVLLTVLIGAVALAVDLGRLYYTGDQVQAAADAAALSSAGVYSHYPDFGSSAALFGVYQVLNQNRVNGAPPPGGDLQLVTYDPVARTTTPATTWDGVTGVQITMRARAPYIFASALGLTAPTTSRTGTAWIANMNGAACVRPVALPYTRIYEDGQSPRQRTWSSQGQHAPDQTQWQVAALQPTWPYYRAPVARTYVLVPPWAKDWDWNNKGIPATSSWHTINYTGNTLAQGSAAFTNYLGAQIGSASCRQGVVQVGDYLTPFTWDSNDSTAVLNAATGGFNVLCNRAGNGMIAACMDASGHVGVRTRVALTDSIPNTSGGVFTQRVREVTQVRIMCYFESTNDVCPATQIDDGYGVTSTWQMPPAVPYGPPVDRGYPAGTVVVLLGGPVSVDITPDIVFGATVSMTQRLLLVK